jgi:hypothetical protein
LATIIFLSVEDAEPTESPSLVSQSGSDIKPGEVTTRGRDLKGCRKSNPSPEVMSNRFEYDFETMVSIFWSQDNLGAFLSK